jgi:hypothetical protein
MFEQDVLTEHLLLCCRCLQDNKGESDFNSACKKELAAYEQKASQDYRLNFRLRTACQGDISTLCKDLNCMKDDSQVSQVGTRAPRR